MPVYVYVCNNETCENRQDEFRAMSNRNDTPNCKECDGEMIRSIAEEQKEASGHVFEPYVDHNLTDKPEGVKVESKKHKEQLKEERGLIEVGEVG